MKKIGNVYWDVGQTWIMDDFGNLVKVTWRMARQANYSAI